MYVHKIMNSLLSKTDKDVAPRYGTSACSEAYEKHKNSKTKTISSAELLTADGEVDYDKVYDMMFMLDNNFTLNLPSKSLILDKETNLIQVKDLKDDSVQEYDFSADAIAEIIGEYRSDVSEEPVELEESDQKHENYNADVVFKKFAEKDGGEVIALFPNEGEANGNILSYMHNGQHGPADPKLLDELEDATPEEYADLQKELENNYDYTLKVLNKTSMAEAYTVDDALASLKEEIETAKYKLDKICSRVEYRTKENVSYFGEDAIEKVHAVQSAISTSMEDLNKLVYSDIIG